MSSWPISGHEHGRGERTAGRQAPLQCRQQVVLHVGTANLRPGDPEGSTHDECDERRDEHIVTVWSGLDDVELEQKRQSDRRHGDQGRFQTRDREHHEHDDEPPVAIRKTVREWCDRWGKSEDTTLSRYMGSSGKAAYAWSRLAAALPLAPVQQMSAAGPAEMPSGTTCPQ